MSNNLLNAQLLSADEALRQSVKELLGDRSDMQYTALWPGETPTAELLIFDLADDHQANLEIARRHMESLKAELFVLGPADDPELLRQAMRDGVREFLFKPLQRSELLEAVERSLNRRASRLQDLGELLAVAGSKGGVGATTVAVNLAVELAQNLGPTGKPVALVDMNTAFGDVPLFLDLDPVHHWGEIFQNTDRLDATFLMSLLTRHGSGLAVLSAPDRMDMDFDMPAEALGKLLTLLREHFAYTVVDLGAYLDEVAFTIMAQAGATLLVSALNLPCLASVKRIYEGLDRQDEVDRDSLKLVFNRYLSRSEISVDDAQEILARKAFAMIPNDYEATVSAINQGKPLALAAPKSASAKVLRKLAIDLGGGKGGTAKKGAVRRGLRLFSKPAAA